MLVEGLFCRQLLVLELCHLTVDLLTMYQEDLTGLLLLFSETEGLLPYVKKKEILYVCQP